MLLMTAKVPGRYSPLQVEWGSTCLACGAVPLRRPSGALLCCSAAPSEFPNLKYGTWFKVVPKYTALLGDD